MPKKQEKLKNGLPALFDAIDKGHRKSVQKLFKDPSLFEKRDLALLHAFNREQIQLAVCGYLIEQATNLYMSSKAEKGLLVLASEKNELKLIDMLIKKEAQLGSNRLMKEQGKQAIQVALDKQYSDVVKIISQHLIEEKIVLKVISTLSDSYLFRLIQTISNTNTVASFELCQSLLIDLGKGEEVLHYAASCLNSDMLQFFIDKGVDPNKENRQGITPLYAVVAIVQECNSLSLKIEKDVFNTIFSNNDTSEQLDELVKQCEPSILSVVRCLLNAGAKPDSAILDMAIKNSLSEVVESLLDHNADPNIKNKKGVTPLVTAIINGRSIKIVKKLIEKGAKIDINLAETNDSLLHLIIFQGMKKNSRTKEEQDHLFKALKYLLKCKLDVDSVNSNGHTPLLYAFYFFNEGEFAERIITTLRDYGADLEKKDNRGVSPKDIAPAKALAYWNQKRSKPKRNRNNNAFFSQQTRYRCEREVAPVLRK